MALENLQLPLKLKPVLLLASGGSALKVLDWLDETALTENLTVTMLDERFVDDPAESNFTQLQETDFYTVALERDINFLGTLPRRGDTLQTLADRHEAALRSWRQKNPQGITIALMGMGPDGHTAGIFPSRDKNFFDYTFLSERWVAGYDNKGQKLPPLRVTATMTFLETIDHALAFVAGEEKKAALNKVLLGEGELHRLPALIWRQMKDVRIFTDIQN